MFETTTEVDDDPRRAPGVAIDPASELPAPRQSSDTSAGVAQLESPADTARARQAVKSYFESMLRGSYSDLEPLVDDQAWFNGGPSGGRQRARYFLQARLSRIDYTRLSIASLYREAEVETYRGEDLQRLASSRTIPHSVSGHDVLVHVRITTPRVGRERLFGDEVSFVLRPAEQGFSIVEIIEEFQLP
ncbi:MAG: hypothetical protein R3B13_24230 [Polyangiaceae bacterium]